MPSVVVIRHQQIFRRWICVMFEKCEAIMKVDLHLPGHFLDARVH